MYKNQIMAHLNTGEHKWLSKGALQWVLAADSARERQQLDKDIQALIDKKEVASMKQAGYLHYARTDRL